MKELDFDELDRAVNTLMGGVPTSTPPKGDDDDTKVITIPSTLSDTSTPVMPRFTSPDRTAAPEVDAPSLAAPSSSDNSLAAADDSSSESSAPVSRLAIPSRRAGRFMDVVHPSSDMKNPSNANSGRPSRTASSIEPLASSEVVMQELPSSDIAEEAISSYEEGMAEPDTVAVPAVSVIDTTETPSVTTDTAISTADETNDWPDPLAGFGAGVSTPSVVAEEGIASTTEDEDEAGDDDLFTIDTTEPDDEPQPLVSPFLSDAKVEKRPLGVASDVSVSDDEPGRAPVLGVFAEETITNADPEDQLPPEPINVAQPLPAELQGDLIAIESDNTNFASLEEPATEAAAVADTPAATTSTEPQPAAAPTGPTSIQQQYKESAATGDQTNGAIYDTEAYHQPLAHPIKKKSGWMWVIWVLLLLIVGAGGAVALYYFELI